MSNVILMRPKRVWVLFLITFTRIGRTDTRRAKPDHILMPGARQFFFR